MRQSDVNVGILATVDASAGGGYQYLISLMNSLKSVDAAGYQFFVFHTDPDFRIGAGAHGKLSDVACGRVSRTERVRQPGRYMAAARPEERIAGERAVVGGELAFEFCLNALRLVDGFDEQSFEARTGQAWTGVPGAVVARERGLLERTPAGRWAATSRGRLFLNDLQAVFLPDTPPRGAERAQGR